MSSLLKGIEFVQEGSGNRTKHDSSKKEKKRKHSSSSTKAKDRSHRSNDSKYHDKYKDSDDGKNHKRLRKERKKRKKRKYSSSSSESDKSINDYLVNRSPDSNNDQDETITKLSTVQREDWMTMSYISTDQPPKELVKTKAELEQEAKKSKIDIEIEQGMREPVTGMLYGLYDPKKNKGGDSSTDDTATSSLPVIGDGGASWRAKMLRRAQERAEKSGSLHSSGSGQHSLMLAPNSRNCKHDVPGQNKLSKEDLESQRKRSSFLYGGVTEMSTKGNEIAPVEVEQHKEKNDPIDLNKLAARALKAQLMGNQELFKTLTDQLNEEEAKQREMISDISTENISSSIPSNVKRFRPTGNQDDMSINDLVREEKFSKRSNMDTTYAKNIMRLGRHYKGKEFTEEKGSRTGWGEDDQQIDMRMLREHHRNLGYSSENPHERIKSKMRRHSRDQAETCHFCLESPVFSKQTLLSLGQTSYLKLSQYSPILHPCQCLIVPIEHASSYVQTSEVVREEIDQFKRALSTMVQNEYQMHTVFLEQTKKYGHTKIECIPISTEIVSQLPIYFKQELLTLDEECGTQASKVIPLKKDDSRSKIQRLVPKNCQYFVVDWGFGADIGATQVIGYAYIIDDPPTFPLNFGFTVLAGMLEMDSQDNQENQQLNLPYKHKRNKVSTEDMRKRITEFERHWGPYNFHQEDKMH